jgi:sialate O-acetylesterase
MKCGDITSFTIAFLKLLHQNMDMLRTSIILLILLAFSLTLLQKSQAQFRVSRLIGDGMVMQRGAEVPVWGWALPGERVTVNIDGRRHSSVADAEGRWKVVLGALQAPGPYEMQIQGPGESVVVRDILVGDVWVASGQSNMEWAVADADGIAVEDSAIRQFKVPRSWSDEPEDSLAGGGWEVADTEHIPAFTAVGYYFAHSLRDSIDVPIGIINTSWGGSRIEPWMSARTLGMDEDAREKLRADERARKEAVRERLRSRIGVIPDRDVGLIDGVAHWADPELDDSAWFEIAVPSTWEAAGFEGVDGVAWYRTELALTEGEIAGGITLGLGMIDDSDISWVNGVEVGRTDNAWNEARRYDVPASVLRAGENVITVRVSDAWGAGGIAGPPETVFVEVGAEQRPLPETWRFMFGQVSLEAVGNKNQLPMLLWNKMIHPLQPFPVSGFIWYQGESNAGSIEDAKAYATLFIDMIKSWRAEWGQGDLPFLWAQLANYMAVDEDPPVSSSWAALRESQSAALSLPNSGQAILIDIGDADDIHPRNKQDVGKRLALAALKIAYGKNVVHSGPTYRSDEIKDSRVIVRFDHVGDGLVTRGESLSGFAIAGADRRFVWAKARIDENSIAVWSDDVPEPVAVRYAWGDNPESANLYNSEGLPASPFRTDSWR